MINTVENSRLAHNLPSYHNIEIHSEESLLIRAPWLPVTEEDFLTDGSAVISIGDTGSCAPTLAHQPDHYLWLTFDDVGPSEPPEEGVPISLEQAEQIALFIADNLDMVKTFVVQCQYGESRSAAVAAAIIQHHNHNGICIFSDERYTPNKYVYHLVLSAMRKLESNDCASGILRGRAKRLADHHARKKED